MDAESNVAPQERAHVIARGGTPRPMTAYVKADEKAWLLRERNLVMPPDFTRSRFQIVVVVRDGKLAEWWEKLGPAGNWPAPEVEIPAMFEHTVAELQDMAESMRHDPTFIRFTQEQLAESTLMQDYRDQKAERSRIIRNQSVFGPGVTHQRNGFPLKEAIEWQQQRTR